MEQLNPELVMFKIESIEKKVDSITAKLDKDYVSQEQLKNLREKVALLQKLVFWFIALIVMAVVAWRMSLLLK